MGVRHLWRYVRSTLCRTIRLTDEAIENRTLIVDGMSGARRYLDNDYLWNFQKLRDRIFRDVEAFHKAGFRLIVIIDGGLGTYRFDSWFQRRQLDLQVNTWIQSIVICLQRLYRLNSLLLSDSPERIQLSPQDWRGPLALNHYLTQAYHEAKCEVHIARESADHEGAGLSIHHEAYGILANDTDFLIYPSIQWYLSLSTLRITDDGQIFVDGVERSLFHRYLGISEEKLPLLVGFLGNDVFTGVTLRDMKYLQYKWKLEWIPEAIAMEVMNAPISLLPEASRLALEYYKPIMPSLEDKGKDPESLHTDWNHLVKTKSIACGIGFDSLSEKPCHDVLAPLRKSIYRRNGFDQVKEFICHPHSNPDEWSHGCDVEVTQDHSIAPMPPPEVDKCITLCCDYLISMGELNDFYVKALVLQHQQRDVLLSQELKLPDIPQIKDLHVANLFLQTVEVLYLGSPVAQPPCWELFHGPLFHYLCQERTIVESSNMVPVQIFDWSPLTKSTLLSAKV
eukprot:g2635.t1